MKVTIKDIARLANVSTATVSMVVNKKDHRITQETKDKVLKVIEKYNYVPNRIASSMVTKNTKALGLVLPDITNPFFPELARGVEDRANKEGWHIILCNSDNDYTKEASYLQMLQEKMVDGIILTATNHNNSGNSSLDRVNVPIITLDRDIDDMNQFGTVTIENEKGAYQAVKYMLSRDYRKIIHLAGPMTVGTAKSRYDGYLRAHIESQVMPIENHLIQGKFSHDSGYKSTCDLIQSNVEFDGLFCGDDMIALGALKALAEHNIPVPSEVGVVGFDDIYISKLITPELTTVHQPIYEMGNKAADLLIKFIENKANFLNTDSEHNVKGHVTHKLSTSLIKRGTTR